MKKNGQMGTSLRIIGGKWRGRRLHIHPAEGLRPTGNRVRETLFNWLRQSIDGAHCLDLFAGSGALGFEAASRGALRVVMVDNSQVVARCLAENCGQLQADGVVVAQRGAVDYLTTCPAPFDIVFVDPPFSRQMAGNICRHLEDSGALRPQALIYVEIQHRQRHLCPRNWLPRHSLRAGQVLATLYQRGAAVDP